MSTTTPATPSAPPRLVTAEEFAATSTNLHAELLEGVVKEYPVPWPKHGFLCSRIDRLIGNFVDAHDLGRVAANDSWVRTGTNPDTMRGGDVCYWSYERLPKGDVPDGPLPVSPDLVVEVRSPNDRWTAIIAKVVEYLAVGVRVVVVLDPKTAAAAVYRDEELQQIFHNGDELTLPDVLPGFRVPVNSLFA